MDELWNDYLNYLIWIGGLTEIASRYGRLFEILHHIDFKWILDRDENREADGIGLRDDFDLPHSCTMQEDEAFFARYCSVFEMMLALAIKVDDEFIGDPAEEHPEEFFMEMIKNLGLDKFKGERYKKADVIKIVNRWLDREFDSNGVGSPFPIRRSNQDQRKLEIWDQMNAYLNENY